MILALPGSAWAGGSRYDKGGHDYGYQKKGHYSSHHNNNNNNYNDKLWIGLLGGGIVGYTLSNIHSGY